MFRMLTFAFLLSLTAGLAVAQDDMADVQIETTKLNDHIAMLKGRGGNRGKRPSQLPELRLASGTTGSAVHFAPLSSAGGLGRIAPPRPSRPKPSFYFRIF